MNINEEEGDKHNPAFRSTRNQVSLLKRRPIVMSLEVVSTHKDEDTTMQDHIITFNKLVCQVLNADEKLTDEEQPLLFPTSLPKDYINIV